jgi:hypothetical protein
VTSPLSVLRCGLRATGPHTSEESWRCSVPAPSALAGKQQRCRAPLKQVAHSCRADEDGEPQCPDRQLIEREPTGALGCSLCLRAAYGPPGLARTNNAWVSRLAVRRATAVAFAQSVARRKVTTLALLPARNPRLDPCALACAYPGEFTIAIPLLVRVGCDAWAGQGRLQV